MQGAAPRLDAVINRIDAINRADPQREQAGGIDYPKELLYAQRMSAWLERLRPDAGDALRIAVRAQHVERWKIPRARFPDGRTGYLRWRTRLARHHAEVTGGLMRDAGYDAAAVAATEALLRKEGLAGAGADSAVQVLEDVVCLVFLEHYLPRFAEGHPPAKVVAILAKTWRKMSPRARRTALDLPFPDETRRLLHAAGAAGPGLTAAKRTATVNVR